MGMGKGERRRKIWCQTSVLSGAVRIRSGQSGYADGVLFGEARSKAAQRNGWMNGVAAAKRIKLYLYEYEYIRYQLESSIESLIMKHCMTFSRFLEFGEGEPFFRHSCTVVPRVTQWDAGWCMRG